MPDRKKYSFPFDQGHFAFNALCELETQWKKTESRLSLAVVKIVLDSAEVIKNHPNRVLKAQDILAMFNILKNKLIDEKAPEQISPNVDRKFTEICEHYIKKEDQEFANKKELAKQWVEDHDLKSQPQPSQATEDRQADNVAKVHRYRRIITNTIGALSQRPVNTDQKLEDPDQRPVNTGPKP